ncbi:response regulator [Vibrio sonorensis]|uniref:response regulator n=1 Tax=Vibrio sonorensis TaxID=1004316 RepID=UPI0008D9E43C|nr:response regulator [Vibrio sonorensis]
MPHVKHLKVMVVDDDRLILDQVEIVLNSIGVRSIHKFNRGEEAFKWLDDGNSVMVILLDLNMPDMDGIEVLRGLATRQFFGGIILFSGENIRVLKTAQS